jgi:hypothetical protein
MGPLTFVGTVVPTSVPKTYWKAQFYTQGSEIRTLPLLARFGHFLDRVGLSIADACFVVFKMTC